MLADLVLIKLFMTNKDLYQTYQPHVRMDALEREARTILSDMGLFYETFPSSREADDKFITWFQQVQHPELNTTQRELYNLLFQRIKDQPLEDNEDFIRVVLKALDKDILREKLQESLEEENWALEDVQELLKDHSESTSTKVDAGEVMDWDIDAIMDSQVREHGFQWPLNCLTKAIGPIIKGDFGVVAAPVECGKTAFMVQMAVAMASQLTEGKVLFFNNEQEPRRVQKRLINAATALRSADINQNRAEAIRSYVEFMHGDGRRIEVINGKRMSAAHIRQQIKKHDTRLVFIDMLDKLKTPGKASENENMRTQKLYEEIRDISQEFCPVIGSSQCDGTTNWKDFKTKEPKYQHYITMNQLQESRVKKQGELEFLVTIGWDPGMPNTRFVHVAKNKLPGDGTEKSRYVKSEVMFDGTLSMFKDL